MDCITAYATGSATSPGIVNITFEDVERSLQQKDAIIIDVRNFDEVAEFGQIPSARILPGTFNNVISIHTAYLHRTARQKVT